MLSFLEGQYLSFACMSLAIPQNWDSGQSISASSFAMLASASAFLPQKTFAFREYVFITQLFSKTRSVPVETAIYEAD